MARAILPLLLALLLLAPATPAPAAQPTDPPDLSQAQAGARIGWIYNDEKAALEAAKADGKPVLLLASPGQSCRWCEKLEHQALRCPLFNTLAGQAHFLLDRHESDFQSDLDIGDFPTFSLISVKGTNANEERRLTGYLEEPDLLQYLAEYGLHPTGRNPLGDAPTGIAPDNPAACQPQPPAPSGWPFVAGMALLLALFAAAVYGLRTLRRRKPQP